MNAFPPIIFVIAFTAVVVALTAIARGLPIPSPILHVAAGIVLSFVPGARIPLLDPDIVFFVFLPPVLWSAAFFTSLRDFNADRRLIGFLAIGLVLATTVAVAFAARALFPGMPWPIAIALGAIVSPPDAVAAVAVVSRLPIPRRVIVVLEGESLVNDASALILYRSAVAAAVTGMFSWGESIVRFFLDAGVGILIGVIVAWLVLQALRLSRDVMAETLLTLAAPYVAWIVAETLHVSAVLACVAGGLYLRQHYSAAVAPLSRLQTRTVWELLIFVLNAAIFLLLGVQFRELIESAPPGSIGPLLRAGGLIGLVVIAVRLVWVPIVMGGPHSLMGPRRRGSPGSDERPGWKPVFLIGWTSMRGIVSLATALALPFALANGTPFPYRSEILVITISVIVLTLLVQGLTLAPIVRAFGFAPDQSHHAEARVARIETARRSAEVLEDLAREPWVDARDLESLRAELRDRFQQLENHRGLQGSRQRLRAEMLREEGRMLVRLRNEGAISDEVMRQLEQEIDLEVVRLGAGADR